MKSINICQLLRIIESIVFIGPLTKDELTAHIKFTVGISPETDTLNSIIEALKEKYSPDFYGIEFTEEKRQFLFKSRSINQIVNS